MPETPLADVAKPFHSDRADLIEPNAFELVEMQRTPKKKAECLIESDFFGFGVSSGRGFGSKVNLNVRIQKPNHPRSYQAKQVYLKNYLSGNLYSIVRMGWADI